VLRAARDVVSLVPALAPGSVDPAALVDPHALEGLDASVLPGVLAVAENGAVWVDGAALPHAALFVIPEHAAYARLASRPPGYGVFIAGPSKTADLEQALVIGAHGARSCTVLLVGSA
jgi:L-lactate dehydrogenase complex protein LldG